MSYDVNAIYNKISNVISKEDFLKRVDDKVKSYAGLCNETMAALLVANEIGTYIENTPDEGTQEFACIYSILPHSCNTHVCALVNAYSIPCNGVERNRKKCPHWR